MRGLLLCAALAVLGAEAAEVPDRRPHAGGAPQLYDEPDTLGWQGAAVDGVVTRDTDHFERNIVRGGAMVQFESMHDFVAVGASTDKFRQGDWSLRVNSLLAALRKVNPATAEGITARGALTVGGNRTRLHGEGVWNVRFTPQTGIELIASRDAVETVQGLQRGTLSNFFAAGLDHALSERLTVIGMPTYRRFSDGNEQTGWRGWLIYTVAPSQGLSVSVKARSYDSSRGGGGVYFSPDHYDRAEIGLRLRRAIADWRVFATADLGRERIDRTIEKPTAQLSLTAQRALGGGAALGLQLAYFRASESAGNVGASDRYAWRMARLTVLLPF